MILYAANEYTTVKCIQSLITKIMLNKKRVAKLQKDTINCLGSKHVVKTWRLCGSRKWDTDN